MDYMCYVSVHLSHLCCYIQTPKQNHPNSNSANTEKGHHTPAWALFLNYKKFKDTGNRSDSLLLYGTVVHLSCWPAKFTWRRKFNFVHSNWNNPATWKIFSFRVFSFSTHSFMNFQSPGKFTEWFCSEIFRNLSSTTDQPSWLLFMALTFIYWKPFSAL